MFLTFLDWCQLPKPKNIKNDTELWVIFADHSGVVARVGVGADKGGILSSGDMFVAATLLV